MRFIDETALSTVLSICKRPQMFVSGSDAIAFAFIAGYLLDKSVYRLEESLHLELDLPSNVAAIPAIRRMFENGELQNPLNFLKVTIERLLRGEDYCVCCGCVVDERDAIQVANADCINRSPGYGIRLVHDCCCVDADWPTKWTECHLCHQHLNVELVRSASETLLKNLRRPGSHTYDGCCFLLTRLCKEAYWNNITKSVDKHDAIRDRYRAARDMHELATREALADTTFVRTRVREAFVPVHQSCSEECRTMT